MRTVWLRNTGYLPPGDVDLLLRSLPRVYVGPAQAVPYVAGNTVGLAGRF